MEFFLNNTSWATRSCLGLCSIFVFSAIAETPTSNVAALVAIFSIVVLHPYDVNSLQLALVSMVGLLLTTITPQQMFFFGMLGSSVKVAIAREGLLYFFPRSFTETLISASVIDILEQPFRHPEQPQAHDGGEHTVMNPIAILRTVTRTLTKRGLLFDSLPETIRWALLPGDMRDLYEERRKKMSASNDDHPRHHGSAFLKSIVHFENRVGELINTNVYNIENLLLHNPAVRTVEKITSQVKNTTVEAFAPTHKHGRVGALVAISALVYVAAALVSGHRSTQTSYLGTRAVVTD